MEDLLRQQWCETGDPINTGELQVRHFCRYIGWKLPSSIWLLEDELKYSLELCWEAWYNPSTKYRIARRKMIIYKAGGFEFEGFEPSTGRSDYFDLNTLDPQPELVEALANLFQDDNVSIEQVKELLIAHFF